MEGALVSADDGPEQRIGRVLRDKWRLDRVLGIGGFGVVYAATHRNGKRVAIKLLHPGLSGYPEVRNRFLREAYAVNAVDHPGVVSVLDDDRDEDGAVFLVMDLLEGESLDERRALHGGTLPADEVLSIADQVLDVLCAAHEKGVIHRDLKPENVFLTKTGQVKLLDFGIAKLRGARGGGGGGSVVTIDGVAIGTPAFMPPEQARGRWEHVDERSDLWALGATMFNLLSGQMVHGDLTPQEALVACISQPAPSLTTVLPSAPRVLVELVDRALAFERDARFQSAREMQEAVRAAYHDLTGSQAEAAPRRPLPSVADEDPTTVLARLPSMVRPASAPRPMLPTLDDDPTQLFSQPGRAPAKHEPSKGRRLASIFDSGEFSDRKRWTIARVLGKASGTPTVQGPAARAARKQPKSGKRSRWALVGLLVLCAVILAAGLALRRFRLPFGQGAKAGTSAPSH
jgi:serine/threonine-protein kinase